MRVALIQMTSVPDLDLNTKSILNGIRKAKEYKADIVLFPENCAFMGRDVETLAAATGILIKTCKRSCIKYHLELGL